MSISKCKFKMKQDNHTGEVTADIKMIEMKRSAFSAGKSLKIMR